MYNIGVCVWKYMFICFQLFYIIVFRVRVKAKPIRRDGRTCAYLINEENVS